MSQCNNSGTLLDLFAGTVARHADRPAATDRNRSLTYAELDDAASALARELRARGVGEGDHVVFYLDRGVQVFVAQLGVLKAGAAYVAVDPRYPEARRDLMIRASRAKLVVTEPSWGSRLSALGVETFGFDLDALKGGTGPEAVAVSPGHPACVLFTSGSTGTPKAAVLDHANLVFFARNPSLPALSPADRVGHVSSVSFDAFHFETWCAFAGGAEVVVLGTMPDLLGTDIQRELRRARITAMLVPSMALNHVVQEDRDAFSTLRILCTGGDVILPVTCRELLAGEFSGELYNLYGPTEATTACTAYRITDVSEDAASIPIGTPLAGAAVHILDDDMREVSVGTAGQLYVGGPGVACGYLDQPELTAERFRESPFPEGGRLYATGDLARRREDGLIEFLGRADDQVKIRGYRVEPGEVERVVARHPDVRDVVVLAVGNGQDRHLVALVVPHDQLSPKHLREYATRELPEFMVPSAFVRVDRIPVNDHGKRDLALLRELAEEQLRRGGERVPPSDDIERYLVDLWEELLAVEHIGAADDFFALGGNSLLAFRVQQRVRRELQVPLEARDVLGHGELRSLAGLIRERKEAVNA